MKVFWNLFLVIVLMAGAGVVGFYFGHRAQLPAAESSDAAGDDVAATPSVQVAPIEMGRIDRKLKAYGVVMVPAGDISILSAPFEARVKKIDAAAGQWLATGSPAIELEPSTDTQLQMMEAKSVAASAQQDLEQTRQRFADHLATDQDLLQAQQNLSVANLKLQSLQRAGAGGVLQLKQGGLVVKVDAQDGQIIPAGGALLEFAGNTRPEVRLGVEPSDAASIHAGDAVSLRPNPSDGLAVEGKVQWISRQINAETRLTDVYVAIPPDAPFSLDSSVEGDLTMASDRGLVVPRAAALPDDDGGFSVFTVADGKAVKHKVSITSENDDRVMIAGDGLSAGQNAVAVGNMELDDGMSVKVVDAGAKEDDAPTQEAAQ